MCVPSLWVLGEVTYRLDNGQSWLDGTGPKTLAQCFESGNVGAVQTVRLEGNELPPREKLQPSAGNIASSK